VESIEQGLMERKFDKDHKEEEVEEYDVEADGEDFDEDTEIIRADDDVDTDKKPKVAAVEPEAGKRPRRPVVKSGGIRKPPARK
jgi:hypothetical protein